MVSNCTHCSRGRITAGRTVVTVSSNTIGVKVVSVVSVLAPRSEMSVIPVPVILRTAKGDLSWLAACVAVCIDLFSLFLFLFLVGWYVGVGMGAVVDFVFYDRFIFALVLCV